MLVSGEEAHAAVVQHGDRAHEVEHDGVELLERGDGLDEVDQRGGEGVEDGPGQENGVDGQLAADGGDPLDQEERTQGPEKGERRHRQLSQEARRAAQPEEQREDAADAGPAGDAQDVGIGQGVPQQCLKDHSRHREGAPEEGGGEDPGQAHVEEHRPGLLGQRRSARQQVHERERSGSPAHTHHDAHRQQPRQGQGPGQESRSASAAHRVARSTPSSVSKSSADGSPKISGWMSRPMSRVIRGSRGPGMTRRMGSTQ